MISTVCLSSKPLLNKFFVANLYESIFLFFCSGHRNEKPQICPRAIHEMMLRTWDSQPQNRPNFLQLMDELGDLLEEGERDHYLDLTKRFDASTNNGTNNAVENKDYLGMMSPPDFLTQTSVSMQPDPEDNDGYLQPKNDGYLQPKCSFKFDNDDYLMPNGQSAGQCMEMKNMNGNLHCNLTPLSECP